MVRRHLFVIPEEPTRVTKCILRLYHLTDTIVIIKYTLTQKPHLIKQIYHIDYNDTSHALLFGYISKDIILNYRETCSINITRDMADKIYKYMYANHKKTQSIEKMIHVNTPIFTYNVL